MKIAGLTIAVTAAVTIVATSALAQQERSGLVTKIDRINGTIAIRNNPDATVGASPGAAEEFKVQDAARLNALHAGDRVTFAVSDTPGAKIITKIEKK
ncbi:copper-binding protein [Bradyrhizobium sp.]|uniref:copper-binding protein n=1 Tax=Bradyrhizobium sp. TaxID=376 RepID=UPI0025C1653D|nr:copper-binding protein [Bradyrhizobium sp.]